MVEVFSQTMNTNLPLGTEGPSQPGRPHPFIYGNIHSTYSFESQFYSHIPVQIATGAGSLQNGGAAWDLIGRPLGGTHISRTTARPSLVKDSGVLSSQPATCGCYLYDFAMFLLGLGPDMHVSPCATSTTPIFKVACCVRSREVPCLPASPSTR